MGRHEGLLGRQELNPSSSRVTRRSNSRWEARSSSRTSWKPAAAAKALVDSIEALVDQSEALVESIEAIVDAVELGRDELHQRCGAADAAKRKAKPRSAQHSC